MAARKPPGMVFVSYAHSDLARLMPLLKLLEKDFNVWWDRDLEIGQTWRQVLMQKLDTARCVVVFWTIDSVHRDFVWSEVDRVKRRGIVIPVKFDKKATIPLGFDQMQHTDLTRWDGRSAAALKKLFAGIRALLARPPPPPGTTTIASDTWMLTNSTQATERLERLTGEIATLAGVFVSGSGPVVDLHDALGEIHKTYASITKAIGRFLAPVAKRGAIDSKPYLAMERGTLRTYIEENRGHCTRILEYYGRVGGIRDWLETRTETSLLKSADEVFGQLATADGDMFDSLVRVGDLLTGEAGEIAGLLISGQQDLARARLLEARTKLLPLEHGLSQAAATLQRAESTLGYVPGARSGARQSSARRAKLRSG